MTKINTILNLLKIQSVLSRKFDGLSLHGISLTDYMILYILSSSAGSRLRRIDLAEKTGLTASGITRIILPLEKIGLVMKENNDRDARVNYVKLTITGKKVFDEASVTAEYISQKLLDGLSEGDVEELGKQLNVLGGDL